ncbi:Cysteine/Histidine-rich C1 domain family protein [Raphanus sativus]|nr:Cysteine/Histidine-rich C1 domain family protein [Raphanus sativus]
MRLFGIEKELEWEPEESEDDEEDIAPFKKLGNGFIKHFGHEHPLKLKKHDDGVVVDIEKLCEACVYPIIASSDQFYDCEECDYSLHEVCAGLPKKLDHALNNQTLFLEPSPRNHNSFMRTCDVCSRSVSPIKVMLNIPFSYQPSVATKIVKVAREDVQSSHLHCTVCEEYALCYECATIPHELHYKYDKHPFTLSYGEDSSAESDDVYWCEVCEKLLDTKEWFYSCDDCCTTVHLQCVFGSSFFMKPGYKFRFSYRSGSAQVIRNSSNTRERCYECGNLCTGSIYYEGFNDSLKTRYSTDKGWTSRVPICSWHCVTRRRYK